jgi:hypothetical protein
MIDSLSKITHNGYINIIPPATCFTRIKIMRHFTIVLQHLTVRENHATLNVTIATFIGTRFCDI